MAAQDIKDSRVTVAGPDDTISTVFRAVLQADADGAIMLDDDVCYALIVDDLPAEFLVFFGDLEDSFLRSAQGDACFGHRRVDQTGHGRQRKSLHRPVRGVPKASNGIAQKAVLKTLHEFLKRLVPISTQHAQVWENSQKHLQVVEHT